MLDDNRRPVPIVTQLAEASERFDSYRCYFMSYAFCDWFFVVARQPHRGLADLEKKCRDKGVFLLHTVNFRQSKSLMLWKAMRVKSKK